MRPINAVIASLVLGAAAVAGVFALSRTVALGPSQQDATKTIAVRQAQLAQASAELQAIRKAHPPALPAATRPRPRAEQVIYVQAPAPPATTTVRYDDERESESEYENENEGELDD